MGKLTTHVLDTARGRPGAGMEIELWLAEGNEWRLLKSTRTNADGRTDVPLLEGERFAAGIYELRFKLGAYFGAAGFLDAVPVRFRVSDADQHYHVPLLCSPWSYTTYRGS
jgi:5-hydroxyisourate hydrolase